MKRLILILTMIGIMTNTYSQSTLLWTKDLTTGLNNYYSEYQVFGQQSTQLKLLAEKIRLMDKGC